jgi:peptide/nickel transport system permease protein
VTGDLGKSLKTGQPVTSMVVPAAINTIVLGIGASLIAFVFGIGAGMIAGYCHGRPVDKLVSAVAITGVSTPHYWLAILLVVVFSLELGWLPAMGSAQGAPLLSWESLRHMILPMIALCAIPAAIMARTTRAAVMEILGQEFVEALRARGLPERRILLHVTKNALPTVLAVSGLQFAHLMGGSILVEIVFAWPGTGSLMNVAIFARDMPVLQGVIVLLTMIFVATNLLVDILQTLFDPRLSRG